jgi:polar amino acid transport system substrate-binding protein
MTVGGIVSSRAVAATMELATPGTLAVGVVEAPNAGVFFVSKDMETGALRGVTIDLGTALAQKLGARLAYRVFPNSGECTDATSAGTVDVAFMPVDDERKTKVAFGPAYYRIESTYLVSGSSKIETLAEIDRPGVHVVGIANTTTIRASSRSLKTIRPIAARSVDEALEMMRSGRADALALSRDSLKPLLATLPGSHILDGGFQQTSIAVAVPKDRPNSLAYVTAFMAEAKESGELRKAFDKIGLADEPMAPAGQ